MTSSLIHTDIHFIDKSRINALDPVSDLAAYRNMIRKIDDEDLAKSGDVLEDLLKAFGKQRQYFIDLLFCRKHRARCIGTAWRKLRDALVLEGYQSPFGLQARHWKMALQAAAATVSNYWRLVQTNARDRIRRKAWFNRLNGAEKHYVNKLLGRLCEDFFWMLDGKYPKCLGEKELKQISSRKGLCLAMVRTIHCVQGRRPRHGEDNSVWFDCDCYEALTSEDGKSVLLKLMTKNRGIRATVHLKGSVPVSSTIRLVRKADGSMDVHVQKVLKPSDVKPLDVPAAPKGQLYCRALDLGFSEVVTDDSGMQYGTRLGEVIKPFAQSLDDKLKERNKLTARAEKAGKAKRRRMMRCNLGDKTFRRKNERFKTQIKCTVNQALNELFKKSPAQVYVMEDLNHRFMVNGNYSRKVKKMLSHWVRGTIKERMLFKSALHGAMVAYVPSAYSSQRCPECGYVSRENRNGDAFRCKHCGYTAHADANAAKNLLQRAGDSEFRRYMGKDEVRTLERRRYEQWCNDRQEEPLPVAQPKQKKMRKAV